MTEQTDLTDASIAASIVDATDRGVHAINMSFGTDTDRKPSKVVSDAIDFAYRRGVVLVAAAADRPRREQGAHRVEQRSRRARRSLRHAQAV